MACLMMCMPSYCFILISPFVFTLIALFSIIFFTCNSFIFPLMSSSLLHALRSISRCSRKENKMGISVSKRKGPKKVSAPQTENQFIAVHVIDESVQEQSTASTGSVESYHGKEQISPFKLSTVSSLKAETKHNVLSVLQGDFSKYIYLKAKIVRIFISSTFTDTSVERNAFMQEVYPKLKRFCQEHGYEFQVVDMRWGIRNEAMDDHQTLELCIREIENCQKFSAGPSFLSLLSEKYGYRPIPAKIPQNEFNTLKSNIPNESDIEILHSWYQLDKNHVPPVYILQPVSSRIPDYVSQSDESLRQAAFNEWTKIMAVISKVLRAAAEKCLLGNDKRKYFASVSEIEIEKGIFETNSRTHGCFWFKRNIEGLQQSEDTEVYKYRDNVDEENQEVPVFLANLQNRLFNKMRDENIKQYQVKWDSKGINRENDDHARYLSKLCEDVFETVSKATEDSIKIRQNTEVNLAIYEEVCQHISFAKSRCEAFHGREEQLEMVHNYLKGTESYPIVVHGESGSGKTSVLSMVSKLCQEWFDKSTAVVIRFLGISPDSSLLRRLLLSLCQQIAALLDLEYDMSQRKDLKSLKDDFVNLLQSCKSKFTSDNPLIIVLDSLDQLSPEDGAFQLTWLPTALPPEVRMVISTISSDKYGCLEKVKGLIPRHCFVSIPRLPINDAVCIVNQWLATNHRTLTDKQRDILLNAFEKCSLPIFLKVSFEEALRWRSYSPFDEIKLESTVRGAINGLFDRIERQHGKIFVTHTLAYITAAKNGLTESELEDILSCDDAVLEDVYQYWVPPVRRIPPLLWLRLKHDLSSYLADRGADESMVVTWYHRQFKEAANERYLSSKEERLKFHGAIAEFFLGIWSNGSRKPFQNKDGSIEFKDRLVAAQNLTFMPTDHCHHGPPSFNLRKLSELPFHLIMSEDVDVLKRECLCNYEFLLTHLRAQGLSEVLDNFDFALSCWPEDKDLITIHETLKLSTNALMLWPGQLSSQLLSRIPKETVAKSECLRLLEKQARSPSMPAFVPRSCCLTSPGGPLLQSMSGSTQPHIALRLSSDGKHLVSIGEENEMLIWDVPAGRLIRTIDCPAGGSTYSCLATKGDIIIISRAGIIKAWYLSTGQPVLTLEGHDETAPISICELNGKEAFAAYFSETLSIVALDSGVILKQFTTRLKGKYFERPMKVILTSWKENCIVGHKDLTKESTSLVLEVFCLNSEHKNRLFKIVSEIDIMSLEIVTGSLLLVTYAGMEEDLNKSRRPSARPSLASNWQKMTLELWDMEVMKQKSPLTTEKEFVRCAFVTPNRNEVVMLCNSTFIETACEFMAYIKIHSIAEKQSLKMPLSYPSTVTAICANSFKCIVTSSLDKIIRVWDLERSLVKETSSIGDGTIEESVKADNVIQKFENYIESKSLDIKSDADNESEKSEAYLIKKTQAPDREQKAAAISKKAPTSLSEHHAHVIQTNGQNNNTVSERNISFNSEGGKKPLTSFPVGRKFLKLRYSNLSSAVQTLAEESGSSLEDLIVCCCYDKLMVYFARRVSDSVFSAIVWNLCTDVRIRVCELQNPEACITGKENEHLVILSSGVLSVYKSSTGEFVRCKPADMEAASSERLVSVVNGNVLVIGMVRKDVKVYSAPGLDQFKCINVCGNEMIVRITTSQNRKYFVICLRRSKSAKSADYEYAADVWSAEKLEKSRVIEYGTFSSEFNDTKISNDGSIVADIAFDPVENKYRLVIWKSDMSQLPEALPCTIPVNLFTMQTDGKKMILGTWSGDILLYDIEKSTQKYLSKAHSGPVHQILLSGSGKLALTIAGAFNSRDRSIRLWKTKNGALVTEFTPDVKISSMTMTNDGKFTILEIQGKLVKFELVSHEGQVP